MASILKSLRRKKTRRNVESLRLVIEHFRDLLKENNRALDLMADAEEKLDGDFLFDMQYPRSLSDELEDAVGKIIAELNFITGNRYLTLMKPFEKVRVKVDDLLNRRASIPNTPLIIMIENIDSDMSDAVGGKMANLGELRRRFEYKVPDGFSITARACEACFRKMRIHKKIADMEGGKTGKIESDPRDVEAELKRAIMRSRLPWAVSRAIKRAVKKMKKKHGPNLRLAIRSSAIGEDGKLTFAGLHDTALGVKPSEAVDAYKRVLASLFNLRAISYRWSNGESLASAVMAAGCLEMVPAIASGVLYTLDPNAPEKDSLIVSTVPGLGKLVVDGESRADEFVISRNPPHEIISRRIRDKSERYEQARDGGIHLVQMEPSEGNKASVADELLDRLTRKALRIEQYMRSPQDIEWAQDVDGSIAFLQTRPLRVNYEKKTGVKNLDESLSKYKVLMSNRGVITCRGLGYGQVVIIGDVNEVGELPENCVIVAHHSSPQLAAFVPKANAVITDVGAPTGHLATVTREFRVPSIMDVGMATDVLKPGMMVTVDAEENVIYEGWVEELLKYQVLREKDYAESNEYKMLRRILKTVAPLNLRNPGDRNFQAANCRTYHDIIRFAHEKAVEYLTQDLQFSVDSKVPHCKKVAMDIPLDLMVIDIGSGFSADSENLRECGMEHINSEPLRRLLEGLTFPGVWSLEPAPMDMESLFSSMTGYTNLAYRRGGNLLRNLAVVSQHYLNLNLHLGYHINQVDSFISEARNDNYIYFRFSGGMTTLARRARRAKMIAIIMEKFDFAVDIRRDFIVARLKKFEREIMLDRMRMIGRLIGFTRQMDVHMKNDSMIEKGVEEFMNNF